MTLSPVDGVPAAHTPCRCFIVVETESIEVSKFGDSVPQYIPGETTYELESTLQNQVEQLVARLKTLYPFNYQWYYVPDTCQEMFVVQVDMQGKFFTKFYVKDEDLAKHDRGYLLRTIMEGLVTASNQLACDIGESKTGKYPFIRLWADRHLNQHLWGHPETDIPGWVFPKFKEKNHDYPEEGKLVKPQIRELPADIDYNVKEFDEVATTKKRTITKPKRTIDPSKVKKPLCAVHNVPMAHDPVEGKWRCTETGCNMVARPKRAADDRSLVLGKGGLQLRLIQQGLDTSVVLISDDNIALDVTKFVDIKEIVEKWDAVAAALVASDNGKQFFNINQEHQLMFHNLKLTVMGSDDLAIMEF